VGNNIGIDAATYFQSSAEMNDNGNRKYYVKMEVGFVICCNEVTVISELAVNAW
jgi:hypothetical protein